MGISMARFIKIFQLFQLGNPAIVFKFQVGYMEDNLPGGAYPLCRGMIEVYAKFLLLNRPEALSADYEKFRMYELILTAIAKSS